MEQADYLRGNTKPDFTDLLTGQKQKGKHESPGKQQFGIFSFKAQTSNHAFHGLEHHIAKEQRPAHGNDDLKNIVRDRRDLTEVIQIHLEHI